MYTSYIGQKFLDIYNRRMGNSYTAAEFFDNVMFPLFFDAPKHLMTVHGSAFFQPKLEELKPENRRGRTEAKIRLNKLKTDISNIALGKQAVSGSILVGGPAGGPAETTSGQVSNLRLSLNEDELYASWIGNALAVRVEGSQCLLFDTEPVLWHVFQGWDAYRNYMKPVKTMEGRQIETWNGYWLAKGDLNKPDSPPQKDGRLQTYPWVEVVAKLLQWHAGEILPAYIFSLSQTNTTYGFINFHLPQLKRLSEARHSIKKALSLEVEDSDAFFWEHYEPDLSLDQVCQLGEIGLRGLRPKDYGRILEKSFSTIKITNKNRHTFSNIQTWIIAMLNNKSDLQKLAAELATELMAAESSDGGKERGKTGAAETKALLETKGLTNFITSLTDFLEKRNAAAAVCRSVVNQSIRIPGEQFPLFKALLRFEYIFLKSNK